MDINLTIIKSWETKLCLFQKTVLNIFILRLNKNLEPHRHYTRKCSNNIKCQVDTEAGYKLDGQSLISRRGKSFCSSQHPDQLWSPQSLLSNGYWVIFSGVSSQGMKLTSIYCYCNMVMLPYCLKHPDLLYSLLVLTV